MPGIDVALFRTINGWSSALAPFMRYLSTANSGWFFKITMLVVVIGMISRGGWARHAAVLSLIAFPITDFFCNSCKKIFPMHRPFQELADVVVWVGRSDSMGTASSHAGNLAAVATVMTLSLGVRWGAIWIVLAFLVGLSRIYVGVHYPSQVLLGWLIGIAVGFGVDLLARFVAKRRQEADNE